MGEKPRRWQMVVGSIGHLARAVVYLLIAWFALEAAIRWQPGDTRGLGGALRTVLGEPGGAFFIAALAAGLLAHALWRALRASTRLGRGWRQLAWAFGDGFVAAFHTGLSVYTTVILVRGRSAPQQHRRSLVAAILAQPIGRVVAAGVGVGLLAFGIGSLIGAWRGRFLRDFDRARLGGSRWRVLSIVGRVGLGVRALLFGLGGALLLRSMVEARPASLSSGDVLRWVAESSYGIPLVALFALGLLAYAALMLAEAFWRRCDKNVRAPS